jgi:hypothetical protein
MPLAYVLVWNIMRKTLLVLVALLVLSPLILPTAEAAPPKALKSFSGSLDAGETSSLTWNLNRDVEDFIFHYEVTGGADPLDVVDVSIDETGDSWTGLMGEGWAYCPCSLSAGMYTVTALSDAGATGRINFNLAFDLVPQPPVDFAGFMPANSSTRISDFGILSPNSADYTLVLGATTGSYELFVDAESNGVVAGTRSLVLELQAGFHLLEVDSSGVDEDVRWTVQVQGQPKLEVSIVNPCPVLNPGSAESICVTGAHVAASDSGTPTVSYLWTASGGQFNSTTSQWVQWTAPQGVATFTLSVQASAPGYTSGSDSLSVQVVPELPSTVMPLVLMLALGFAVIAQKRSRTAT